MNDKVRTTSLSLRGLKSVALLALIFLFIWATLISCGQKAEEGAPAEETAVVSQEGIINFEGQVKTAVGNYMYVPQVSGFDLYLAGDFDASTLIGKEVKGEGEYTPERPSLLIVNTLEVKDESGTWQSLYTRSEEPTLEDYIDLKAREAYETLENLAYNKNKLWEGKETVKVYGQLEEITKEGQEPVYKIIVLDEKGKQIGRILIDNMTDFARYYLKKLHLYNKFWFYLKVKETVPWRVRRRTRELFHADLVFAGLF